MDKTVIKIEHFTKRYGHHLAVDDLSLEVPRGSIVGLLGRNGAGKSTTIKALLNLIRPTQGRLTVLGYDSIKEAVRIHQHVGYVPEKPGYYEWMTVEETLAFNAGFYPTWDADLAESLLRRLRLPADRRLGKLSLGMAAKVGLVIALGPRPELLILDDPTSGLDAVVRQEFLEMLIAHVHAEGGTVLFSSHLLHEIERVADQVAIIDEGRLLTVSSVERLKSSTKKIRVVYADAAPDRFAVDGLLRVERGAHDAVLTLTAFEPDVLQQLRDGGAQSIEVIDLSLEEIFVERTKEVAHV